MSGSIRRVTQAVRSLWQSVSSPPEETERPLPEVIIHDPEAAKPHDLDDPFFDRDVQSRMADVIASGAGAGHKAEPDR